MDSGFSVGWDGSFCRNLGMAWSDDTFYCMFFYAYGMDGWVWKL